MRRGLPLEAPAGREALGRRPVPGGRAASSRGSAAPWWHQPLLWVLMLASAAALNAQRLAGDDRDFELVRSIVIDHRLPVGRPADHAIELPGAPLLWSPFVLAANAGVEMARSRGSQVPDDGRSWPYRWAFALGTAMYAFLALGMSYRLARRFAKPAAALIATIAIWLGSALPVYVYMLPFATSVGALFAAALFFTLWISVRDGRDGRARWFVWGLAGGLAISASLFNAALLTVAVIECVTRLARRNAFVDTSINGATVVAGALLLVLPVLAIKRRLDGGWLIDGNSPIVHGTRPQILLAAFSAQHGVFLWTPILLVATIGLVVAIRRQPALASALVAAGALFFYLAAGCVAPAASSYAGRFLLPLTPIFVCGLAALMDALVGSRGRIAWAVAGSAAALLVLWNFGLMLQWGTGLIPDRGPVDFRHASANQVTVVPRAAKDFVIRYVNDRKGLVSQLRRGSRE